MTRKIKKVYQELYSDDTIKQSFKNAIKHKSHYKAVKKYKSDPPKYEKRLKDILQTHSFTISPFEWMHKMTEHGKVRDIPKIPLIYDQVAQHCLLNVMWHGRLDKGITDDAYNCIRNRGINSKVRRWNMAKKVKRTICEMRSQGRPIYFMKCDIRKHYPSVRHSVYRRAYRHSCKDKEVLDFCDTLNYSIKGLPIGWATGAPASHMILRELDHWIKEELKVKHYFRFADDIVILHDDKKQLHEWLWRIRNFMWYVLKQEMKGNYKVAPISENLDFGGYVFKVGYTKVRKSIKKNFVKKRHKPKSLASYLGILKHCDSRNLIKKVINNDNKHMTNIKDIGIKMDMRFWGEENKHRQYRGRRDKNP